MLASREASARDGDNMFEKVRCSKCGDLIPAGVLKKGYKIKNKPACASCHEEDTKKPTLKERLKDLLHIG